MSSAHRPVVSGRRWPWIVSAILVAASLSWAAAGFLLLPWLAKRELPRIAEEQMQLRLRIGDIAFNPFSLKLRVADIAVGDRAGLPLAALAAGSVQLDWRSLPRRAWMVSEISLQSPSVNAVVAEDGRLNLAALIPPDDGKAPSSMPRFDIGALALRDGSISFEDRREGYQNRIEKLSFDLSHLSSLAGEPGRYSLNAQTAGGARLRWTGDATLSPLAAGGTLVVEALPLAELTPYFDDVAAGRIVSGSLDVELPYRLTLPGGRPEFSLAGAKLAMRGLALTASEASVPFASIGALVLDGIQFASGPRHLSAQRLRLDDVKLVARRDVDGSLDLDRLLARPKAGAASPGPSEAGAAPGATQPWLAEVSAVEINGVSASLADSSAKIPVAMDIQGLKLHGKLSASSGKSTGAGTAAAQVTFDATELSIDSATAKPIGSPAEASVKLGGLTLGSLRFDSGARTLDIGSARIASMALEVALRQGRLSIADLMPGSGIAAGTDKQAAAGAKPFAARLKALELADGTVNFLDADDGIALALERVTARLGDLSTEALSSSAAKPVTFDLAAAIKSGGRLGARGRAMPAAGTLDATVEASGVALAPLQPLLARYAGLRLAAGDASLAGRLVAGGKEQKLLYAGSAAVTNLALDDAGGSRLVAWKSLATSSLRLSLSPNRVDIDELRLLGPVSALAIAKDGTSNLSRALPKKEGPPMTGPPLAGASAGPSGSSAKGQAPGAVTGATVPDTVDGNATMAVQVRRLRMDDGVLEFSDESIGQGFKTRIHELAGTANGLSSDRETRSQFAFEGRIDEFGFARLSGSVNVFAPRDRTTFRVEMRNVDLTRATPYSVRFAGYRIASGRLGLDVNYRLRGGLIEGENHFTLEQFSLGERVDSPDALKLPFELAIALLKDSDGRIVLDLPITGSLDDPQFSIAPLVWKAIGNLIGGIVTAPFRALARLFGGNSTEQSGTIAFDAGASRLLPPERANIIRVSEILAKRPQLKLAIPARYDSQADARALRRAALAREVGRRAGFAVGDEEAPGPVSTEDRRTREVLRALFAERFSPAELDKLKFAAEAKSRGDGAAKPALLERLRNLAAGEPQIADAREFYATLLGRLRDAQPLPPNALTDLARRRGEIIETALREAGVAPERLAVTAAPPSADAESRQVTIALSLSAR